MENILASAILISCVFLFVGCTTTSQNAAGFNQIVFENNQTLTVPSDNALPPDTRRDARSDDNRIGRPDFLQEAMTACVDKQEGAVCAIGHEEGTCELRDEQLLCRMSRPDGPGQEPPR